MEYRIGLQTTPFTDAEFRSYVLLLATLDAARLVSRAAVDALISAASEHVAVATTSDGVLVGTARLHVQPEPEGSSARIEDVVVAEAHRRQGIAHRMLMLLEEQAGLQDVLWCELTSKPFRTAAHELYRSHGYGNVDTFVFVKHLQNRGNAH